MQDFRAAYARLRAQWLGTAPPSTPQGAGSDRGAPPPTNAAFAARAAYDELVPAFEALYEREGRDWPRFYDAVRQLTRQPLPQRHEALRALHKNKETPSA